MGKLIPHSNQLSIAAMIEKSKEMEKQQIKDAQIYALRT